jgi:hypothetical protein
MVWILLDYEQQSRPGMCWDEIKARKDWEGAWFCLLESWDGGGVELVAEEVYRS